MKLIEANWKPADSHIRQFSLICFFALIALGYLWEVKRNTFVLLGGIGLLLIILGWTLPRLLKPIFIGLIFVTLPIGMVIGEMVMGLIYFGIFTPMGLCFKCMKRDALKRKLDPNCESYWDEKRSPSDVSQYYRQW